MGGFSVKVNCPECGQIMNPANLAKHSAACEENRRVSKLFKSKITTRQLKSFRKCISQYGLTVKEYVEMWESQNGVCAICEESCGSRNRLTVDHCHTTGKVRGLLCNDCNRLLGEAKERISVLQSSIDYLQKYKD